MNHTEECNCDQALSLKAELQREKRNCQYARDSLALLLRINASGKQASPEVVKMAEAALET